MPSSSRGRSASQVTYSESESTPIINEPDSDSSSGSGEQTPAGTDAHTHTIRLRPPPQRAGSTFQRLERYGATSTHLVRAAEKNLEEEGVEHFNSFDRRLGEVDAALRLVASTMQLFGSSVGVLHSIYQLRKSLLRLRFHFRENAGVLYGSDVKPNAKRYVLEVRPDMKANGNVNPSRLPPKSKKALEEFKAKNARKPYRTITGSMKQVDPNLRMFIVRLNEIAGFHDEAVNQTFIAFADEVKYRAEAFERLEYYPNKAFKEYINKLAGVFDEEHLNEMLQALKSFQKNSIPVIQRSQEHRGLGLQGLSAVATFFSGITASTIAYQTGDSPTPLQSTVTGLWITSLACSTASAVSAQVVYFWRTSRFSSPPKQAPGIIVRLLQYMPLAYLALALSTFMIGLSVYTFSSNQEVAISVIIAVFTGVLTIELAAFGAWIALERIAFKWTGGKKWFYQMNTARLFSEIWAYTIERIKKWSESRASARAAEPVQEPIEAAEEGSRLDVDEKRISATPMLVADQDSFNKRKRILQIIWQYQRQQKIEDFLNQYPQIHRRLSATLTLRTDKNVSIDHMELLTAVPQHNGLIKHLAFSPDQKLLATCGWDGTAIISNLDRTMSSKFIFKHTKVETSRHSQPQGKQLFGKPISEETCVREVAWSPDCTMLATRTRRTVRVWSMKDGSLLSTIQVGEDRNIESIAWSWKVQFIQGSIDEDQKRGQNKGQKPKTRVIEDSQTLVVMGHIFAPNETACPKFENSRFTWAYNKEIILKDRCVTSIAIVNDPSIPDMDTSENFRASIVKNASAIALVANNSSIPIVNSYLLVGIGVDTKTSSNIEPEKFLFMLNFASGKMIGISPLAGEAHTVSVTVSQKNIVTALVTYKAQGVYPQLWRIKVPPSSLFESNDSSSSRHDFVYVQSYFSKADSEFSGDGCFGGLEDVYVCCSSQEGEIFIWNRENGHLLFTIKPAHDEHLKFFSCNKLATPDFKCASGAVDGTLSLWTAGNARPMSSGHEFAFFSDPQYPPGSTPRPLTPVHESKRQSVA